MEEDRGRYAVARAMVRAELLAGCEREWILGAGLVCATLVMVIQTWIALISGMFGWVVVLAVLRRFGKHDPIMSKVYARHARYRRHYAPRSTPWAASAMHKRG